MIPLTHSAKGSAEGSATRMIPLTHSAKGSAEGSATTVIPLTQSAKGSTARTIPSAQRAEEFIIILAIK